MSKRKIDVVTHKDVSNEFITEILDFKSKNLSKRQLITDPGMIAAYYNRTGLIYYKQKNHQKALALFKKSLQIAEALGDLNKKIIYLNNIGGVYKTQGNIIEALKAFESIIQISEHIGNLAIKATYLNRIGLIYHNQGDNCKATEQYSEAIRQFKKAMKQYKAALQIAEQLEDLTMKATYLNNIAGIYNAQGNYPKALIQYGKSLQILSKLELENSSTAIGIKKNIESIKKIMMKDNKQN